EMLQEDDDGQAVLPASSRVHLQRHNQHVVMSNGIVNVSLTVPGGLVTSITYKGSENLLQTQNKEDNRGLLGTSYKVIARNRDYTEISFTTTWAVGSARVPLNVDKRYVMLRDSPGFIRMLCLNVYKDGQLLTFRKQELCSNFKKTVIIYYSTYRFHYMAMSDERQRVMPMSVDRYTGEVLDYPEAVLLTRPTNSELKGEVDDKYLYSCDNKNNKVHGWVSQDVGFWMITPSNEFRTGGPFKQDLTSHVGPTVLSMFITHYAGRIALKFQSEEYWKKVFGQFTYISTLMASAKTNPSILSAKQRMQMEEGSWPYNFPFSKDFLKSNQRGAARGQLLVHDWTRYHSPIQILLVHIRGAYPLKILGPARRAILWRNRDSFGKQRQIALKTFLFTDPRTGAATNELVLKQKGALLICNLLQKKNSTRLVDYRGAGASQRNSTNRGHTCSSDFGESIYE
ncbi:hypothetical protein Sango_1863800, partial [Sesamum angolense]